MSAWHDYAKLEAEGGCVSPDGRFLIRSGDGFHRLGEASPGGKPTGWKLHVSVAGDQVGDAWNALVPYLLANGVTHFKVAGGGLAEEFSDPSCAQAGKMMTIYAHEGVKDWEQVASGMERLLESQGIRPGADVAGDKAIPGSRYIHYRNDKGPDGTYVSAAEAKASAGENHVDSWNPSGAPDPFGKIDLGKKPAAHTDEVRNFPLKTVVSLVAGISSAPRGGNDFPAVFALAGFVAGKNPGLDDLEIVKAELAKQVPQLADLNKDNLSGWLEKHHLAAGDELAIAQLSPAGHAALKAEMLQAKQQKPDAQNLKNAQKLQIG